MTQDWNNIISWLFLWPFSVWPVIDLYVSVTRNVYLKFVHWFSPLFLRQMRPQDNFKVIFFFILSIYLNNLLNYNLDVICKHAINKPIQAIFFSKSTDPSLGTLGTTEKFHHVESAVRKSTFYTIETHIGIDTEHWTLPIMGNIFLHKVFTLIIL